MSISIYSETLQTKDKTLESEQKYTVVYVKCGIWDYNPVRRLDFFNISVFKALLKVNDSRFEHKKLVHCARIWRAIA